MLNKRKKPSPTPPWRGFSLVTDCQLEPQVASARPFIPKGGQEGGLIRERTNPSHRRYPWLILNVAREPKASEHILWGTVFQTALPSLLVIPETASRVTLASLGIGFQPKLSTSRQQNKQTTKQADNKTIHDIFVSVVQSSRQGLVCVAQFFAEPLQCVISLDWC